MTHTFICVGGPADGHEYELTRGSSLTVPVRSGPAPLNGPRGQERPAVSTVHYEPQTIFGDHVVMVPKGQTLEYTVRSLVAGYPRKPR